MFTRSKTTLAHRYNTLACEAKPEASESSHSRWQGDVVVGGVSSCVVRIAYCAKRRSEGVPAGGVVVGGDWAQVGFGGAALVVIAANRTARVELAARRVAGWVRDCAGYCFETLARVA